MPIISKYKPIGFTPLQLINLVRKEYNLPNEKISYVGRLDPMAHGLMVLLVGEDRKKQEIHQKYDKVYQFQILFGIKTDTYDILGKIINNEISNPNISSIQEICHQLIGKLIQPFPPYSAIMVNKKPLWSWAKEGKLDQITIPKKEINIYNLEILESSTLTWIQVQEIVKDRISKLDSKYDFRQDDILLDWHKLIAGNYLVVTCQAKVSSGTYIRSLANLIGEKLNTSAIAFDILRKQVGDYYLPLEN